VKVHIFEKKQEIKLWVPELVDSIIYKGEWSQYSVTMAVRYYPITFARVSPYVDAGLIYSNVTEKYEAIVEEWHGNPSIPSGGFGGMLAGGLQVWLMPELSVFGEVQVAKVRVKGRNEWLGIEREHDAGGRLFGAGVCLSF
jgi:hypothetical protein